MVFLKVLLIAIAVAFILFATLVVVSACMLSGKISREEEQRELERLWKENHQDSE